MRICFVMVLLLVGCTSIVVASQPTVPPCVAINDSGVYEEIIQNSEIFNKFHDWSVVSKSAPCQRMMWILQEYTLSLSPPYSTHKLAYQTIMYSNLNLEDKSVKGYTPLEEYDNLQKVITTFENKSSLFIEELKKNGGIQTVEIFTGEISVSSYTDCKINTNCVNQFTYNMEQGEVNHFSLDNSLQWSLGLPFEKINQAVEIELEKSQHKDCKIQNQDNPQIIGAYFPEDGIKNWKITVIAMCSDGRIGGEVTVNQDGTITNPQLMQAVAMKEYSFPPSLVYTLIGGLILTGVVISVVVVKRRKKLSN